MPLRKSHDHVIFHLLSHIHIFAGLQMHAADLHADLEEYPQAIARYEQVQKSNRQVADYSLTSPLTKYSVKEYWLRAGLCALALGVSILYLGSMILLNLTFPSTPGFGNGETEHDEVLHSRYDVQLYTGSEVCPGAH
jgi:hypothetical protein